MRSQINAFRPRERTIFVTGSFDCFHQGHRNLFLKARKIVGKNGRVVGVVNGDNFFKAYKGFAPLDDEMARLAKVREFDAVDIAFVVPEFADQMDVLDNWRPDFLLHGADWTGESLMKNFGVTPQWLEERNILFIYVDRTPGVSSSEIRKEFSSNA